MYLSLPHAYLVRKGGEGQESLGKTSGTQRAATADRELLRYSKKQGFFFSTMSFCQQEFGVPCFGAARPLLASREQALELNFII